MLRRSARLLLLGGILALPSCIVVTCGETRTIPLGESRDQPVRGERAGPAAVDTSSQRW